MAKSKQQKREEALARQLESFKDSHKWFIARSNPSGRYYDAHSHQLAWDRIVQTAYAARVDIHGNYLPETYYKKAWQIGNGADPKWLAENATAYTLEELKQRNDHEGRSLFKAAYGTRPVALQQDAPYDVGNASSILGFLAGEMMKQVTDKLNSQ